MQLRLSYHAYTRYLERFGPSHLTFEQVEGLLLTPLAHQAAKAGARRVIVGGCALRILSGTVVTVYEWPKKPGQSWGKGVKTARKKLKRRIRKAGFAK